MGHSVFRSNGSQSIHGFAVAVDAGEHVGVAYGTGLYQIDATPQQGFQLGLDAEKTMQVGGGFRGKLGQKVGIAALGVKVIGTGRRAEYLKSADFVALANGRNTGAVLGDGGGAWAKFSGCGPE
jgi:hypothetical protein